MTAGRLKIWNADAGEWEYPPGGGSQPVDVGRPKPDTDEPMYGVPFTASTYAWVSVGLGGASGDISIDDGKFALAPWLVTNAIDVTELLIAVNDQSSGDTVNVRAAIVASDLDWQPDGAPIAQSTFAIPDQTFDDTFFEDVVSLTVQPGLYLVLIEADGPIVVSASRALFAGQNVCSGIESSALWAAAQVTKAYGAFTDPVPRWDTGDVLTMNVTTANGVLAPVFFQWNPIPS